MAGNVQINIPRNASLGSHSYRYPPARVKKAVLKLIARAEYNPWAMAFCLGDKFSVMKRMKAKWAMAKERECKVCDKINVQRLGNQ